MQTFVMDFQFKGYIRQRVRIIKAGWTPEMVTDALDNGTLFTTIAHDGVETHGTTITDHEGMIIARIDAQRAVEDQHEFLNFSDSTDIDFDMMGSNMEAADVFKEE